VALLVPAHAQHADAGVERQAATAKEKAAPQEPPPAEHAPVPGVSTLKRLSNPGQLSEGVRARLEQQNARHAANLPREDLSAAGGARHEPAGSAPPELSENEPLRRGEARMRRVQAVDTHAGVTVLSNRLVLPEPSLVLTAQLAGSHRAEAEPEAPATEGEALAVAESPSVTETHSLRALAPRSAKSRLSSTGLGWLVWPFVLFVLGGAVVGTLWFRNKTE
jgi:hypothetical protein